MLFSKLKTWLTYKYRMNMSKINLSVRDPELCKADSKNVWDSVYIDTESKNAKIR